MIKRITASFLLTMLPWTVSLLYAQTGGTSSQVTEVHDELLISNLTPSAQLAMSSPDYMVTAGDVYTLTYLAGTTPVEYIITVDSSYRIRISNLGVIDSAGKTFNQLKAQVETIVLNNYPLGAAQLILLQPAVFKVYIKGEVRTTREMQVWALSRLSSVLGDNLSTPSAASSASRSSASRSTSTSTSSSSLSSASSRNTRETLEAEEAPQSNLTPYSSTRNIQIRSSNGQVRTYDLFMANRAGDLSQNPFVRPDDIITVNRIDRKVTINGEVERPGTYELLRGENLKQLIEVYGYGLTEVADTTRINLTRYINRTALTGDRISLHESDVLNNFSLEHLDSIMIPSITAFRPSFFVEGAVNISETELATSNHLTIDFVIGDTYGAFLRQSESWFSAVSDTQNAYIIRDDARIPLNINPLLYDPNYKNDLEIRENDTLVVPFRQYFVSVAGAVHIPGRYPYIPDRGWDYYIGLAGGFTENNSKDSITLMDMNGRKMSKGDPITPETTITAQLNAGLYKFNRIAPVITTILSIFSTTLTLMIALGTFN